MKKIFISLIVILLIALNITANQYQKEPRSYNNAKIVRLLEVKGNGYVQRGYEEGREEARQNLPVFDNDTVATEDGMIELYFGRLNYLRMDSGSEIKIVNAPVLRGTSFKIQLLRGVIYLDINNISSKAEIEIQTNDCGSFILREGLYKISSDEGATSVYAHKGSIEVSGENNSKKIQSGEKVVYRNGHVLERPFYANESASSFDKWNINKHREMVGSNYSSRYLKSEYSDYERELNKNGRWSYSTTLRCYVWIPYSIPASWSPYSYGRWLYHPGYGQVWVSYDSWGWHTHYYGSWYLDPVYGWAWHPGYRWSPAWVYWSWNDSYCSWSPYSRYNYYIYGRYYNPRASIVIRRKDFIRRNISNHVIRNYNTRRALIGKISVSYTSRSPIIRSNYVKVSNRRGNVVRYKSNAISNRHFAKSNNGNYTIKRVNKNYKPNNRIVIGKRNNNARIARKNYNYNYNKVNPSKRVINRNIIQKNQTNNYYKRSGTGGVANSQRVISNRQNTRVSTPNYKSSYNKSIIKPKAQKNNTAVYKRRIAPVKTRSTYSRSTNAFQYKKQTPAISSRPNVTSYKSKNNYTYKKLSGNRIQYYNNNKTSKKASYSSSTSRSVARRSVSRPTPTRSSASRSTPTRSVRRVRRK